MNNYFIFVLTVKLYKLVNKIMPNMHIKEDILRVPLKGGLSEETFQGGQVLKKDSLKEDGWSP